MILVAALALSCATMNGQYTVGDPLNNSEEWVMNPQENDFGEVITHMAQLYVFNQKGKGSALVMAYLYRNKVQFTLKFYDENDRKETFYDTPRVKYRTDTEEGFVRITHDYLENGFRVYSFGGGKPYKKFVEAIQQGMTIAVGGTGGESYVIEIPALDLTQVQPID